MSQEKPKSKVTTYIIAAVLIILVLSGAGYYVSQMGSTTTTTAAPKYKDTIVIGTTDSIATTLDPTDANDYFAESVIMTNIGAPLVAARPGSAAKPSDYVGDLASDWTVSSDAMTYTFNLRQGVKFGDGSCCFNATTVKYTMDRGSWASVNDANGVWAGFGFGGPGGMINSTDVTGPYQVVIHLNYPYGGFLAVMGFSCMMPVNQKYAPLALSNYTDGNARASTPLDFGPYVLSSWTRVGGRDTELRMDANPYYWNASAVMTPHLIWKFYSDATALALAIKSGDIDIAYRSLAITDIMNMMNDTSLKVWTGPSGFIQFVTFDEGKTPYNDVRVRRAVAAAINRNEITSTVFRNLFRPLYSMYPYEFVGHTESFRVYGDPGPNYTYTQKMLGELGYSSTHKLVIDLNYENSGHYPASADVATVLKSQLEGSGVIQVNLHGTDFASFTGLRNSGSLSAWQQGDYTDYIDPDDITFGMYHSQGASWLHDGYNSTSMDNLIMQARAAPNGPQRDALYTQIDQQLAQDVPMIPLYQGANFAVSKPNVGGIVLDVTLYWYGWLLYETTS